MPIDPAPLAAAGCLPPAETDAGAQAEHRSRIAKAHIALRGQAVWVALGSDQRHQHLAPAVERTLGGMANLQNCRGC